MAASATEPTVWHRSSYSDRDGGNCVEWAYAPGTVAVRDSKRVRDGGPVVRTSPEAWTHLLTWTATHRTD
jgi:hypothetical protein